MKNPFDLKKKTYNTSKLPTSPHKQKKLWVFFHSAQFFPPRNSCFLNLFLAVPIGICNAVPTATFRSASTTLPHVERKTWRSEDWKCNLKQIEFQAILAINKLPWFKIYDTMIDLVDFPNSYCQVTAHGSTFLSESTDAALTFLRIFTVNSETAMDNPPFSGIKNTGIFRCYVRNYRGVSQTKNKQPPFWCFQKTMELSNIQKNVQVPQVEFIFASNSSLEKRMQHPVKCNRRAALPPDTGVLGHFFIRWKIGKRRLGWVHVVGVRWSDLVGFCLL